MTKIAVAVSMVSLLAACASTGGSGFSTSAKTPGVATSYVNAVVKPEGAGPFPAVVIVPGCVGARPENVNTAKEAVARGYVALLIDGNHGVDNCSLPLKISHTQILEYAFQALDHLHQFDFVDKDRIGLLGFSFGGSIAMMAASPNWSAYSPSKRRYAASVSFYALCQGGYYQFLNADVDRPLLVLMGELDNETPPEWCSSTLDTLKARNAPVAWHLYPKTHHCWDCQSLHNYTKTDWRGNRVTYVYDEATMLDSRNRTFEFLVTHMKPKK